jgi:glycosyltransferase involved in cell wall biosynthesis
MPCPRAGLLVSHPHAAPFAVGLASALAGQDRLAALYTGVGAIKGSRFANVLGRFADRWPTLHNRIHEQCLRGLLRAQTSVELGARVAGRIAPFVTSRVRTYDCLFCLHDAAVSRRAWPRAVTAVYAYEDGARSTFERAAARGLARIWDLPTPHHTFLASMRVEEGRRWPDLAWATTEEPAWKVARKGLELELANAVCVASRFTAASLPDTVADRPVLIVPYGFPADTFPSKRAATSGPLLVLAVGAQSAPKGTHYLLEAWRRANLKDARLRLVGPMRLPESFVSGYRGLFEHVPHVPRAMIGSEYRAADLVVFPTLGDGFGLVIQEAMASATPVLTTPCGGGPECITDGVEGWIVPPRDIDALVERLEFAAGNRETLRLMGTAARERAESWSWDDAARRLVDGLTRAGVL